MASQKIKKPRRSMTCEAFLDWWLFTEEKPNSGKSLNIKYLRTRDGQKWYGIRDTNRITFAANGLGQSGKVCQKVGLQKGANLLRQFVRNGRLQHAL